MERELISLLTDSRPSDKFAFMSKLLREEMPRSQMSCLNIIASFCLLPICGSRVSSFSIRTII